MRVGFWRLKAALDLHGIAPTLAINGAVPAAYPRVTQACREAGWEFMVHGYHQMATHLVEDQRAMIRDAIAALREAAGHEPVGWLAPGLTETLETPDLLAEAGYSLLCGLGGRRSAVPHPDRARTVADHAVQRRTERHSDDDDPASRGAELYDRTVAQFERLYEEAGAGGQGHGPGDASVYQRRAASDRLVRAGAGLPGRRARHTVLAGAADHGLVSEG